MPQRKKKELSLLLTPAKLLTHKWIAKLLSFTTIDLQYHLLHLDGELLKVVSFLDQRSESTMIPGPEVDDVGDGFLACHSYNLSHTICSQQIGRMGSLEKKSFD